MADQVAGGVTEPRLVGVAVKSPAEHIAVEGCRFARMRSRDSDVGNGLALVSVSVVLTNRSAPPATVTPVLIYPDVRAAVAWLYSAFGFEERVRIGDGHRAQLRVGADGAVVVADVRAEQVAPSGGMVTHLVKVRVADVDAAFARARDFGARVLEAPRTWEYGERSCVLEDMAGHRWELTQTVRDVEPEEWGGTAVAPW